VQDFTNLIAPLGALGGQRWAGVVAAKPWHYAATVAIPHLDTLEPLLVALELWRLQSARPYLMVIDTGSPASVRAALEVLRAPDLEIHFLGGHAYRHPSEPVGMALDVAHALCRTEYLFHTHADVFPRRPDLLEAFLTLCGPERPVVGYRMSSRAWATDDWQWCVAHTLTMLHLPAILRSGAVWNFTRHYTDYGFPGIQKKGGWPDTETGFNMGLRAAGITPYFVGQDMNHRRLVDMNHDHCRSYPASKVYNAAGHARASAWMEEALVEARQRIALWSEEEAWAPSSIPPSSTITTS
jgi:hypothetical protein